MSGGTDGRNGIGWMVDFAGRERITIAVDLIDEDFDVEHALTQMAEVKARYLAEEDAYDAEIQSRQRVTTDGPSQRARRCAVYRFFDASGALLYVGKAVDPIARQKNHERRIWWPDVDTSRTTHTWFDNERLALDAEDAAIRDENPLYNRVGGGRS